MPDRPGDRHHGTLDKYTGDGLVAFWGAPITKFATRRFGFGRRPCYCAARAFTEPEQQARGYPPLRVRIGIDSGLAMAGDFGTAFRSIYTAVGDSVNTASRLEQAARDYPHDDHRRRHGRAGRRHQFQLGERLLRGKEKPTVLYTLIQQ
jgi:adenylate cyclase